MPRRARLLLPNIPLHIIQRGNNRSACFYGDDDYRFYLECLTELAAQHDCAIHAFCLMTNHVHLLLTPATARGASQMMKGLGQRYVQHINRTYQRTGTLWEGRFRSCLLQQERYLLTCYRYIELNPVRAGMVEHPAEYRWSSYRVNGQGEALSLIQPHPLYLELGRDGEERQRAYRGLFEGALEKALVDEIRGATHGNFVAGSSRFAAEIAAAVGRRVEPGKAGRPRSA